MSLQIASLNSGSNANCYYIGNHADAILIDAGLSCRETERRMKRLELSMQKVRAIFITHEHTDHIKGVEVLSKKHKLPVYITPLTLQGSRLKIDLSLTKTFYAYAPVRVGSLKITAFPKLHDAADPHSFVIEQDGVRVGVLTDIGSHCEHVVSNFKSCHAVFLEANYDEKMLEEGRYPYYLKKRIRGEKGHLSNDQALELFMNHRSEELSLVLLSHLSKENNCPELVQELFCKHASDTRIIVASRYEESDLFYYSDGSFRSVKEECVKQASLF